MPVDVIERTERRRPGPKARDDEPDDVPQDLDGLEDFVVGLALEVSRLYPAEDWDGLNPSCKWLVERAYWIEFVEAFPRYASL